jgi:hypothetical protein
MIKLKLKLLQFFCRGFLAIALLCSTSFANAVIIESELTSLGGNSYLYEFNVINNDLTEGIEEFVVYFEPGSYENLNSTILPIGWDVFIDDPIVPLPLFNISERGVFDAFIDTALAIGLGEALGGFSIAFNWIGTTPAPDAAGNVFEVLDPNSNFDVVASGVTTAPVIVPPPPNPIPEPSILPLFGLALLFVGSRKRFRQ